MEQKSVEQKSTFDIFISYAIEDQDKAFEVCESLQAWYSVIVNESKEYRFDNACFTNIHSFFCIWLHVGSPIRPGITKKQIATHSPAKLIAYTKPQGIRKLAIAGGTKQIRAASPRCRVE